MNVRPIDASRFGEILEQWKKDCLEDNDTQGADIISDVMLQLDDMPTLTPPNEPLTIKQLQKMVGEPVYDYLGQEWYVIQEYYDHELTMTDGTRFFDDDEIDGVDKRFYRRPPEGET